MPFRGRAAVYCVGGDASNHPSGQLLFRMAKKVTDYYLAVKVNDVVVPVSSAAHDWAEKRIIAQANHFDYFDYAQQKTLDDVAIEIWNWFDQGQDVERCLNNLPDFDMTWLLHDLDDSEIE